jgi:hypothetical protein
MVYFYEIFFVVLEKPCSKWFHGFLERCESCSWLAFRDRPNRYSLFIFLLVPTSCHTYLVNQLATNLLGCNPLLFCLGSSR